MNYLTSRGEDDIFVLRLDVVTGAYLWAANIGGSTYDEGRSIVADISGYLYTVGYFTEKSDMDPSGCVLELDPEPNGLNYYCSRSGEYLRCGDHRYTASIAGHVRGCDRVIYRGSFRNLQHSIPMGIPGRGR